MPRLKPETQAARKAHILTAALTCFARTGYHQTTIDDIAAEAGLSKGSIYVHFESKKELFLAIFDWMVDETRFMQDLTMAGKTCYERLVGMIDDMIRSVASPEFRAMSPLVLDTWLQNLNDPDINAMISGKYVQYAEPLIQLIEEGIAAGEFKPVDSSALAGILIAIFDGLMVQTMVDSMAVNWTGIAETLNTLVTGLLAEPLVARGVNEEASAVENLSSQATV